MVLQSLLWCMSKRIVFVSFVRFYELASEEKTVYKLFTKFEFKLLFQKNDGKQAYTGMTKRHSTENTGLYATFVEAKSGNCIPFVLSNCLGVSPPKRFIDCELVLHISCQRCFHLICSWAYYVFCHRKLTLLFSV